jgi:hypothetical protein
MNKLLPLAALLAVPAAMPVLAQDGQVFYASSSWPVHAAGGACTMVQGAPVDDNVLSVGYDGADLTLTSTSKLQSPLPATGKVNWTIVFLDNGNGDIEFDEGWGTREFTYARVGEAYRFTTRIAGEGNVRQFLSDLASSRTIGLLQRGQAVVAYELAGVSPSVAQLRDCAARRVAAN